MDDGDSLEKFNNGSSGYIFAQVWESKRSMRTAWRAKRTSTLRWLYILSIGAITALVAVLVTYSTWRITDFKFHLMNSLIQSEQDGTVPKGTALGAFIGISCALAAAASFLVVVVSPQAAGSGIPEIKTTLNGVVLPGVLKFRTLVRSSTCACL